MVHEYDGLVLAVRQERRVRLLDARAVAGRQLSRAVLERTTLAVHLQVHLSIQMVFKRRFYINMEFNLLLPRALQRIQHKIKLINLM